MAALVVVLGVLLAALPTLRALPDAVAAIPFPGRVVIPAPFVPGATRLEHGVPLGYAHTQAGAVAAAANYELAIDRAYVGDGSAMGTVLAAIAAPDGKAALLAQANQTIDALAQRGRRVANSAATILAYRVERYDPQGAVILTWEHATLRYTGPSPTDIDGYDTQRSILTWVDGDWRLVDETSTDGPAPADLQGRAVPEGYRPYPRRGR